MDIKRRRAVVQAACAFVIAATFAFGVTRASYSTTVRALWFAIAVVWTVFGVWALVRRPQPDPVGDDPAATGEGAPVRVSSEEPLPEAYQPLPAEPEPHGAAPAVPAAELAARPQIPPPGGTLGHEDC